MKESNMRICWVLIAAVLWTGCSGGPEHLTAARAAGVDKEVRAFARDVAHGVTQEGPMAWRRYFAGGPEFFMAVEGRVAFPNGASAMAALPEIAQTFERIELQWGDDLRVDPLTPDFAMMAATYHEIQTRSTGERMEENGYFTGIAEYKGGRWRFRNAHWSAAVPLRAVR